MDGMHANAAPHTCVVALHSMRTGILVACFAVNAWLSAPSSEDKNVICVVEQTEDVAIAMVKEHAAKLADTPASGANNEGFAITTKYQV
eukprot:234862-Rhodomonas_salina.1